MTNEEYLKVQEQIVLLSNLVKAMPLKEFIEAADRADTIGPFVDPTLWRDAQKNLAVIMELARGLMTFQEKVQRLLP